MGADIPASVKREQLAPLWKEAEARSSWDLNFGRADAVEGSEKIGKGDRVEVVGVKGLRLKVKKIK